MAVNSDPPFVPDIPHPPRRAALRLGTLLRLLLLLVLAADSLLTATSVHAAGTHSLAHVGLRFLIRPKLGLADAPRSDARRPDGMAVDIIEALASKHGFTVSWVILPPAADVEEALRSGAGDVVADWGVSEIRALEFAFSSPFVVMPVNLFVRTGSSFPKYGNKLAGIRLGVVERNISDEIFSPRRDIRLHRFNSLSDALFGLLSGEIDAVSHLSPVLLKEAQKAGIGDRFTMLEPAVAESSRAFAMRIDDSKTLALLDEALKTFVATPEYNEIYLRWFGKPLPFWTMKRIAVANAAGVALIVLGVWIWRYRILVRLNRELAETRARFQTLAESTSDLVWEVDSVGTCTFVGPAVRIILGYEPEEVIGKPVVSFLSPASRERIRLQFEEEFREMKPVSGVEQECLHKSGKIVCLEAGGVPFFDGKGGLLGYRGIARDITIRKTLEEELRRSEGERLAAQKYEAVGRLAAGVAHNLNNQMTIVSGYGSLVLEGMDPENPRRRPMTEILRAVEQAKSLTGRLLSFSSQAMLLPEVRLVDDLVDLIVPSLRKLLGPDIELTVVKGAGAAAAVRVDVRQFDSVVEELAKNAKDAMASGGSLRIETRIETVEGGEGREVPRIAPGRYAALSVADTGCGMDHNTLNQLYEPFFTTKGFGRGIGFPAVYGFVRQSRGFVDVSSEVGKGTTVTIALPLYEKPLPT